MATEQSKGNSGGSSDEAEQDAKTMVSKGPATKEKTPQARADTSEPTAVAASPKDDLSVGDATTQISDGGFGGVAETTLDVDADELEEMRVHTEQVAITSDRASTVSSRLKTRDESTRVGSKSKARSAPPIPQAPSSDDDNVGDITAVTDLNQGANLDASDILAQRMEEGALTAATQKIADEAKEKADSDPNAVFVSGPLSPEEEAEKQEAMATNPLASSRASATPEKQSPATAAIHLEEEGGESLADLVRQVSYKPPTKLAALGSSIVLFLVAGLWVAGDGQARPAVATEGGAEVEAGDTVAMANTPTTPVDDTTEEPDPSIEAALSAEREAAAAQARRLAREKAEEEERLAREAAANEAAPAEPEIPSDTVPEELVDPAVGEDPLAATTDDPPADTEPEVDPEEPAVPEEPAEPEMVIEADTPAPETGPADTKRPPKLSRKQQRAAAQALYKKASTAFMQGKLAASEKSFRAALKTDPSLAIAHRGLGLVYERRGNKSKAASSLRRYLKQAPRAKDAAAIRARITRLGK